MNKSIKIVVPGKPHPQQRARHSDDRKQPRKSRAQKDAEDYFRIFAMKACRGKRLEGPVMMVSEYVFDRPRKHFAKCGEVRPAAPFEHTDTPDKSNLDKHVEDCLNKLAYFDDRQITIGLSRKRWAEEGERAHTFVLLVENRPEFWRQMISAISEKQ